MKPVIVMPGVLWLFATVFVGQNMAIGKTVEPRAAWTPGTATDLHLTSATGAFDRNQLRRGLQIFVEVCGACHGLEHITYADLTYPGGPELSIKSAKQLSDRFSVTAINSEGENYLRNAKLSDRFVNPFPNKATASAANDGYTPPDLSFFASARALDGRLPWEATRELKVQDLPVRYQVDRRVPWALDSIEWMEELIWRRHSAGAAYIHDLLLGYEERAGDRFDPERFFNVVVPGNLTAMPTVLFDGMVEYLPLPNAYEAAAAPETREQYAEDISAFLYWTALPPYDDRQKMLLKTYIYLVVLISVLVIGRRRLWRRWFNAG